MSIARKTRAVVLGSAALVIVGTIAGTAWLLKPTWDAYRERVAFEQAARARLDTEETMQKLAGFARQSGLPSFVESEVTKDQALLVPFYLRAYWYCVYRAPRAADGDTASSESRATRVYRLEIPLENYEPQTDNARKLISRVGQIEIRNTPSGPVEEPALPLEGEAARRVAFMWDFYELMAGRTSGGVRIRYDEMHSDSP